MSARCKEMTERLKIIEDQEIEAIDGGLEFAACNLELLNKIGCSGVHVPISQEPPPCC
jgi:hypothetical protein